MNLGHKGPVPDACKRIVDSRCVGEVKAEGDEVVRRKLRDVSDVEYGGSMNHTLEDFTCAVEHPIHVGIISHLDLDILGGDWASVVVDDVEGDVDWAYVGFEVVGDW